MSKGKEIQYAQGEAYLVLRATKKWNDWILRIDRVVAKKPAVGRDEIALLLNVKLPAALFEKPTLSASINVEGDVPQMDLSPETIHTIEDVIRSTSGLDVQLTLVEQGG